MQFNLNQVHMLAGLVLSIGLLLGTGCGGNTNRDYIPEASTAREALQAALQTWQEGTPLAPIVRGNGKPVLTVYDARWQNGEKLQSFEIVGEVQGREHPTFDVKVKFAEKPEEQNTFLVVGIDPLLVFRDVDYQRATGM